MATGNQRRWQTIAGTRVNALDKRDGSVFGVDVRGWVEQHRSREPYEVVREPIQNALDTGTDLYVRLGYADRAVVVEDFDPAGVADLSRFYDLFAGDKYRDPEQRGRFGRGIKEFIGASDETVIASTGGAVRFAFDAAYDAAAEAVTVEATRDLYPDATRDHGTVVYGTNADWTRADLETVQAFVEGLWMPPGQELQLEVYDGPDAVTESVVTHRELDLVLDRQYLPTVTVENGMFVEEKRRTAVEVRKTEPGDGGIYELGIPVTTEEAFPVTFNVQQKVPVTERRNELANSYRATLMETLINERLELFDDAELAEEYVTQHVSKFSYKTRPAIQDEYIRRRFDTDPEELLVYTNETPSTAVAWAVQQQIPTEKADEYSRTVRGILTSRCPSVQEWYADMRNDRAITEIDEPGAAQAAVLNYLEKEITNRCSARDVTFKLADITGGTENGQVQATYSPDDAVIYLNALADDWNEPSPQRIGTALHELGHHESVATGHGQDWYQTVEELSGEVIQSLHDDLGEQPPAGERRGGES